MGVRQYFYTDGKGVVQKYEYCTLCGVGPFKQEEQDTKYKSAGGGRPITYCIPCFNTLGLKDTSSIENLPPTKDLDPTEKKSPTSIPKKPASVKKDPVTAVKKPKVQVIQAVIVSTEEVEVKDTPVELKEPLTPPKPKIVSEEEKEHDRCLGILQSELSGKKPIPTKSPYSIYIAQSIDGSYICGVTTNLVEENKKINSGEIKTVSLPIEIVYYRTEKKKEDAYCIRRILSKYKREQKERLIQVFEKQFFAS